MELHGNVPALKAKDLVIITHRQYPTKYCKFTVERGIEQIGQFKIYYDNPEDIDVLLDGYIAAGVMVIDKNIIDFNL